jgi:opacity protein-like surface antigen
MVGKRLAIPILTAAVLTAGAAQAADYPQPPPPPPIILPPPQEECCDWYLRGHVGVGITGGADAEYIINPSNSNDFAFEHTSYSDAFFIGLGIGYEFNHWLRFDVTGEYRSKSRVYAYGTYTDGGGGVFGDIYEGYLSSWVFLANAYVDLGTWYCFTPFVGVGIGGSYNMLTDFTDRNQTLSGRGYGRNPGEWNLAWALHAGVSYSVSKNFKVELAYRYLNFGSITDTVDCVGGCFADSYKFKDLYSHDFMLTLRWNCCDFDVPPPRYVYTPPPPVYMPPPVHSRG